MKDIIMENVNNALDDLVEISRELYNNPEVSEKEYESSKLLVSYLEKEGFDVKFPYLDFPTGFRAEYESKTPGLNIGFFCEYDALPEIGHGCGHNLICTTDIGAAMGLKGVLDQIGGKITVFGTPAEETNGAKGIYGEKGAYEDVDIALITHPNGCNMSSGSSLALVAVEYEFFGKAAHAAFETEKGINALDGVLNLFYGISQLRPYLKPEAKIHGIIHNGGVAANMIPDYASARFYMRANTKEYLNVIEGKINKIAESAAIMSGTKVEHNYYELSYDDLVTNKNLSKTFDENLKHLTNESIKAGELTGSMDMGNVSHFVPAISPMIGLGDDNLILHTKEFAEATVTDAGRKSIFKGAVSLAWTAYDVMTDKELQKNIRDEFEENKL